MVLWPSKKQWNSWTLPSKYTFIGVILGLVLGIVAITLTIVLFSVNYFSRPSLADIVRTVGEESKIELSKKYPIAHTVFGAYQDGFVVPKGQMSENLQIKWSTGRVQSINNNVLMVTLPDMILNGKASVGRNKTFLEKRIGAKSGSIIQLGWFNPILEVIGIDGELVVVALGFPADDSKK